MGKKGNITMQEKKYPSILQTKNGKREISKNAIIGRKKVRTVSRNTFPERKIMNLIKTGELEIDSNGFIWRNKIKSGLKSGGDHLIKIKRRRAEHITPIGYLQIRAMFNWKRIYASAHRVVWQHYYGNILPDLTINHKNGIKYDNRIENLEVVTLSENMKHAFKNNPKNQWGEKNPNAKLSNNDIEIIRNKYATGIYTQKEISYMFGVAHQTISGIIKGKSRQKQEGYTDDKDKRLFYKTPRDNKTGRFIKKSPCRN